MQMRYGPIRNNVDLDVLLSRCAPEPTTGCYLWMRHVTPRGYGLTHTYRYGKRKTIQSHRLAYILAKGEIPEGLQIDHLCRTPLCINPDHLEAVTGRENLVRGTGFVAQNVRKTHCSKGHLLVGDNIRMRRGRRVCKSCSRLNTQMYRQKKLCGTLGDE